MHVLTTDSRIPAVVYPLMMYRSDPPHDTASVRSYRAMCLRSVQIVHTQVLQLHVATSGKGKTVPNCWPKAIPENTSYVIDLIIFYIKLVHFNIDIFTKCIPLKSLNLFTSTLIYLLTIHHGKYISHISLHVFPSSCINTQYFRGPKLLQYPDYKVIQYKFINDSVIC